MIDALAAMTASTEAAAKALDIMGDIVREQRAEIDRLRKIVEETAPHRLEEGK